MYLENIYIVDKLNDEFPILISRGDMVISDLPEKIIISVKPNPQYVKKQLLNFGFTYEGGMYKLIKKIHPSDRTILPMSKFKDFNFNNTIMTFIFKNKVDDNGNVDCDTIIEELESLINTSKKDLDAILKLIK